MRRTGHGTGFSREATGTGLALLVLVLVALCGQVAHADDAGVSGATIDVAFPSADTQYASLSRYDCTNNATFDFEFAYDYISGQEAEFLLSLTSDCTTPSGITFQNTSYSCSGDTSCPSIILDSANGELSDPSDGETTDFSGLSPANPITTGGMWSFYTTQISDMNGSNTYNANNTSSCGPSDGVDTVVYICVVLSEGTTTSVTPYGALSVTLDSEPPSVPSQPSVTALDSGLAVSWTSVSNASYYTVYVFEGVQPADGGTNDAGSEDAGMGTLITSSTVTDATSTNIFDLSNGVSYTVYVTALDGAGTNPPTSSNASGLSPGASGTPVQSFTFFQEYKADGGPDNGYGCASTDRPLSLALLVVALFSLRRRQRRRAGVALPATLLIAGLSLPVRADVPGGVGTSGPSSETALASSANEQESRLHVTAPDAQVSESGQSPEWIRLDLLVGPFTPNPDQGIAQAPFARVFPAKNQLLWRLQLHVNLYSDFGHLSVGLGVGVWETSGHSLLANGTSSADTETFTLYPFTPMLGYRADFIYRRWNVPVVPYVKLGWGFVWWADSKNGTIGHGTSTSGAEWHAEGWATGPEWAGGIEFPLEFLDQQGALNMDAMFGINSIGIFGEFGWQYWKGTDGGLPLGGWSASGGVYIAF